MDGGREGEFDFPILYFFIVIVDCSTFSPIDSSPNSRENYGVLHAHL